MCAAKSSRDDALLVQAVPLVQRWLDAPFGQKAAIVQQACTQLGGISLMSFHRLARRITGERLRKRRSDAGKISLPRQEALLVSAYLRQALRGQGKRNASVQAALTTLRNNGAIRAQRIVPTTGEIVQLSNSAVLAALRHYGLHPDQLERLTPHTHLVSPHANWCWQMDASVCVVYYLPSGEAMIREMRKEEFYAGKPQNWQRIAGQMVIRYLMVEHRWGMVRLHYVHGAESGENACDHLIRTMLRPEDPRAMLWGVPVYLMVDPGSAQTGSQFKRLCRRMGINLIINKPGNPRAKGSVEQGHNLVERSFEHGLKLLRKRVRNIDDLNREADVWQRWTNAHAVHSRYNGHRFAHWAEDVQGHLVMPPDEMVMRDLATREPVQRTVGDDYSIPWEGSFFYAGNVPDIRLGEKVLVHRNPWRGNELVLIREDEHGNDIQFPLAEMVRDEAGQFAQHGAVIGQEYRSAPDSLADTNRKEVTRVLAGEATLEAAQKKLKRKDVVPLEALGLDPLKQARETPLPEAVPEASSEHVLVAPVVMVSKMRAARLIRDSLGRDMTDAEFAWVNQRWPERVPEEQIANLVAQFGRADSTHPVPQQAAITRIAKVA